MEEQNLKNQQEQQCNINDVSKQREILVAWNNWMKNNYPDYIPIPLYIIDKFLSN